MELTWKAVYPEGCLNQYNEDGSVNKYTDIDRSKLHSFELHKGEQLIFRLILEEGQRLIFRRRVAQNLKGDKFVVYLVGWQKTIGGENIQSISYVFEDGHIEMAGQWKEKSDWFYAPNLIKEEKDGSSDK
ncbi:MAG: hypothetical protein KJI69_06215 [Patescibacteria group bacterium]|nr:hypothetical protein [Patescibacteria group bacterium]